MDALLDILEREGWEEISAGLDREERRLRKRVSREASIKDSPAPVPPHSSTSAEAGTRTGEGFGDREVPTGSSPANAPPPVAGDIMRQIIAEEHREKAASPVQSDDEARALKAVGQLRRTIEDELKLMKERAS